MVSICPDIVKFFSAAPYRCERHDAAESAGRIEYHVRAAGSSPWHERLVPLIAHCIEGNQQERDQDPAPIRQAFKFTNKSAANEHSKDEIFAQMAQLADREVNRCELIG